MSGSDDEALVDGDVGCEDVWGWCAPFSSSEGDVGVAIEGTSPSFDLRDGLNTFPSAWC